MSAPRVLKRCAMAACPRSIGYPGMTVVSPSAARPASTSAMPVRRSWATTRAPLNVAGPCTMTTLPSTSTRAPILFSSPTSVYRPSKMVSLM